MTREQRKPLTPTSWPVALLLIALAAVSIQVAGGSQAEPEPSLGDLALPTIAMPSQDLELSFVVPGKIEVMAVKPEQYVTRGQLLAQLDDRVQRQQVRLAELAAEDDTRVESARERLALAERDLERVQEALEQEGVTQRELDDAQTSVNIGRIELTSSRYEQQQNKAILERERASLEQMRIVSPIDGVVAVKTKDAGESTEELQPVLRVVDIDPLWFDVAIPARYARSLRQGDTAEISWRDLPTEQALQAHVLFVSSVGDAASSTLHVRLEAANPARIPAGQHAHARFLLTEDRLAEAEGADP
ncbi:MAG: efflux RND transporter periplasmic adaptor subunit [Phycisphaerales bacterium JB038]